VIPAILLALIAGIPASAGELWRGSAESDACELELVNELGGVRIVASSPEGSVLIIRGPSGLAIEAAAGVEAPVLSVVRTGDAPGGGREEDVELAVPLECGVTVRTTAGTVLLDVGRQAFAATVDTVTGEITARVDPDTKATILFATSGEITTDFNVEIDFRYHAEPAKHGRVALRAGTLTESRATRVRLTSRRGAIRLLRPSRNNEVD
jgi:hypothetical protein